MTKNRIPALIALAATLVVAAPPAASVAAPSKPKAQRIVFSLKVKNGRALRVPVWVTSNSGSDNEWRCGIMDNTVNKELDAAQDAYESGNYGDINGHLQTAAQVAKNAQLSGCTVKW